MNRLQIDDELKEIFRQLFNSEVTETERNDSLLYGPNKLRARDLVYFMLAIENHFQIHFSETSIQNYDLFTFNQIANYIAEGIDKLETKVEMNV